jgi:polyhydroxyalkanoate synthesis regulator phasin
MGIGLGIVNPATEENPLGGVGIGAAIWLGLTALIALFFGGWTTAKLAGSIRGLNGVLHSIVMWGLVTIASFLLMTTIIGNLVGGAASIIGKSLSAVASGVSAVAPEAGKQIQQELSKRGISVDSIMNEARQMLGKGEGARGAGAGGGAAAQGVEQELRQTLQKIFSSGQQVSASDKETLVNTLVSKANMSRPEAERTVDNWVQQYQQLAQGAQQAKQQALQTTEKAMDTMSKAGIWLFVLLVLEAAAAAFGGWLGSSREDIVATHKV